MNLNYTPFYLIDNEGILGHSLNYMALLIGASMFVLWSLPYSLFVLIISTAITVVFVGLNKQIVVEFFLVQGGFLLAIVGIFMVVLIKARYDLTLKEIKARLALKESNQALAEQKYLVESKNKKIVSSINYAKRIQDSVLGNKESIKSWFSDAMVLFKPKDVLSGDFYWFYQNQEQDIRIIIAADCTGHGVPAALMTIMGSSLLNEIVIQNKVFAPHKILHTLDYKIIQALNSNNSRQSINDGMDVTVLTFHQNKVFFSGAKNPMLLIQNQEATLIKGAKYPIGSTQYAEKAFESQSFGLNKGDKVYMYSDGYQDQFGHDNKGKYLNTRFRELLLRTASLQMAEQEQALLKEFESWRGDNKQTDDLLVVGIQI
jgi:serine phosphatase RsbU (regulator of sigma subunit)